jgi:hypothetical protein
LYSVPSKDVRLTAEHSNRPLHILTIGLLFLVCSPSGGYNMPAGCTDMHRNIKTDCASRGAVVAVHAMKAYRGVQAQLKSFTTSALHEDQSSSTPRPL